MDNKILILVILLVVVVFLAGGFVLLQNQKLAGMEEKSGRLILSNPTVEITENGQINSYQFSDGSMPLDCCGENDWQRVRLDAITAGGLNKPCLFTHPRNNGTISLIYKNIKLKKNLNFVTALADIIVTGRNSSVYMDVYVNDVLLQRITQEDKAGWFTTDVDTSNYQNKLADVKVVVSTDNNGQRWFCWDAQTID